MSRFDWNPMQSEVESLINDLGQDATLIQKRDTGSGTVTDPVFATARIPVVVVDQGTKSVAMNEPGGVIIQKDYRKFLMSTAGVKSTIAAVMGLVRGAWSAPEVLTEKEISSGDRDDFEPIGDNGTQATNLGMFVWYTEGDTQYLLNQNQDDPSVYYKQRNRVNGEWQSFNSFAPLNTLKANETNANRNRDPLPTPNAIRIEINVNENTARNLPPISPGSQFRRGILIDDATGQSLYYCNDQIDRCEHYRRSITINTLSPERVEYKTPIQSDVLELTDGTTLTIKEAKRTSPAGVDLLYEIYLE